MIKQIKINKIIKTCMKKIEKLIVMILTNIINLYYKYNIWYNLFRGLFFWM